VHSRERKRGTRNKTKNAKCFAKREEKIECAIQKLDEEKKGREKKVWLNSQKNFQRY